MPRALMISHVFPHPLHDGGRVDVFHRLETMHELGISVHLIAFYNPRFPPPQHCRVNELCTRVFPVPTLRRSLRKLLTYRPYMLATKENWTALQPVLERLRREHVHFDFLFAESSQVSTIAHRFRQDLEISRVYLRNHNDEPRFLRSVGTAAPLLSLARPFFQVESIKYATAERSLLGLLRTSDTICHISQSEYASYRERFPQIRHRFLPAGTNVRAMRSYMAKPRPVVLFAGALFSPNNVEAVGWYVRNVHPKLLQRFPGYVFVVAGSTQGLGTSARRRLYHTTAGVEIHDTPVDLRPFYERASIFVNPMQRGSGVKLKSIEAISHGLPVVTTPIGNEGTGMEDGKQVIVASSPARFAEAVATLLADENRRRRLTEVAQAFLRENYDQKSAMAALLAERDRTLHEPTLGQPAWTGAEQAMPHPD